MRLSRRDKTADAADAETEPASVVDDAADEVETAQRKGRPTPKRRDAEGRHGPVSAPKTRKEAYARQKQLTKQQRRTATAASTAKPRSVAEQRAALRRGDLSALPRRDQGNTRKLARDYVDSKRMLSNYLLWLFPIMIVGILIPAMQIIVLVVFLALLVEWYIVGKRIRALAMERFGEAQGGNMSIGFYAGSRAYLPRRWRLPGPQVQRGDAI
jgi:hypothetical protein